MIEFFKNKLEKKELHKIITYKEPDLEYCRIISSHVNKALGCGESEGESCKADVFANSSTHYFISAENEFISTENEHEIAIFVRNKKGEIWKSIAGIQTEWIKQDRFNWNFMTGAVPELSCAFIDCLDFKKHKSYKKYSYVYGVDLTVNWDVFALSIFIKKVEFNFAEGESVSVAFDKDVTCRLKLCSNSKVNLSNMALYNNSSRGEQSSLAVPELAMDKINEILKNFIVRKFGKDTCPDFTAKTLQDAFALAYFPTEPWLFYLMDSNANPNRMNSCTTDVFTEINVSCKDDRADMNIFYKHFGKVPDSIKKMYRNNPEFLMGYLCLKKAGITDINFIRNIIDAQAKRFCGENVSHVDLYGEIGPIIQVLQNDFNCPQKKIIRILYNDKSCGIQEWKDCIQMFLIGIGKNRGDAVNWKLRKISEDNCFACDSDFVKTFFNDGVCRHTHDFISKELYKLAKANISFKLTESQKKRYECIIDDFSFKIAEDSWRLVDIGSKMSICVGTYDGRVLYRLCLIVYAEKHGEYKACIEVREGENMVHQARAKCNQDLTGDADSAFRKWLRITNLKFNGNSF